MPYQLLLVQGKEEEEGMDDKIVVQRLAVRNITGVDNWERERRQPLFITITVHLNVQVVLFL
jgi:hypothetical protein